MSAVLLARSTASRPAITDLAAARGRPVRREPGWWFFHTSSQRPKIPGRFHTAACPTPRLVRLSWPAEKTDMSSGSLPCPDHRVPHNGRRTVVVACAVLEDEVNHFAGRLPYVVHVELLRQGLHNEPPRLRRELQAAVERVESGWRPEVVALGYGLCSRGVEGVHASSATLVLARAHDCMTLLLGSSQRYLDYVRQNPGTYWYSPGWNRHHLPPGPERYETVFRQYVEKYGRDNAEYLMQVEHRWYQTYNRATFVDLGVTDVTADLDYTRRCAEWLGWTFDRQRGDPKLLHDLLAGPWDDQRFVLAPPGYTFRLTGDSRIVEAVPLADWSPQTADGSTAPSWPPPASTPFPLEPPNEPLGQAGTADD